MERGANSGNRLLDSLEQAERDRLLADARPEEMAARRVLIEPGKPIERIFFPVSGMISLVTLMSDGSGVEVATVGKEGVAGVPAALDPSGSSGLQGIAQVGGLAISVEAAVLREEMGRGGRLAKYVTEYVDALFTIAGQNAACNRLHSNEQRCTRWLLMTHDRVEADQFSLTHEFLAEMLGVRRASVSEVAGALQQGGAISYARGLIKVEDRDKLRKQACECYDVVAATLGNLYGSAG